MLRTLQGSASIEVVVSSLTFVHLGLGRIETQIADIKGRRLS